jgi:hypothetical protein
VQPFVGNALFVPAAALGRGARARGGGLRAGAWFLPLGIVEAGFSDDREGPDASPAVRGAASTAAR